MSNGNRKSQCLIFEVYQLWIGALEGNNKKADKHKKTGSIWVVVPLSAIVTFQKQRQQRLRQSHSIPLALQLIIPVIMFVLFSFLGTRYRKKKKLPHKQPKTHRAIFCNDHASNRLPQVSQQVRCELSFYSGINAPQSFCSYSVSNKNYTNL